MIPAGSPKKSAKPPGRHVKAAERAAPPTATTPINPTPRESLR